MKLTAALLALAVFTIPGGSQNTPTVSMDYTNAVLAPSHWALTLHPDGSGHFHSESAKTANGEGSASMAQAALAANVDREIRLSPAFAENVFKIARSRKYFQTDCESHLKVAYTGAKKLSYSGAEGQGSCEFNYSNDKQIQALAESLDAVANTILEGAKLEALLQYDRLGLDKEMEFLSEAAGQGRAQQLCTIRAILTRLADDDAVLDRVKKRARTLLARAEN